MIECRWCKKEFEPEPPPDKIKTPGTAFRKDGTAFTLHAYPVGCFYCSMDCCLEHSIQFNLAWAGERDGIRQDVIRLAESLMPLRL